MALVQTAIEANQAEHVLDPCNVARSMYVDTGGVSAVDFGLDEAEQDQLLAAGQEAARAFLETWDFERWLADCR